MLLDLIYYNDDASLLFMYGLHWAMAPEDTLIGNHRGWTRIRSMDPGADAGVKLTSAPVPTRHQGRRSPQNADWLESAVVVSAFNATSAGAGHAPACSTASLMAAWIWRQFPRKSCWLLADCGYRKQPGLRPKAVTYVCQEKGFPCFPFISCTIFGTNWSGQKVLLAITVCGFLSMHKLYLACRNWPDEARTDHVKDRIRCMCTKFGTRTPSITRPSRILTTLWPHTTRPSSPHTYVDSGLGTYFFHLQSNSSFSTDHVTLRARCFDNIITSMTQQCHQVASTASSPVWFSSDTASWLSHLDSTIVSWTRQQHYATTNMVQQCRHPHRLKGLRNILSRLAIRLRCSLPNGL
jgi:hypothetical protein